MSDDLHTRLHAAITARLEVARAAAAGPWTVHAARTGIRSSTPYAWVLRPDGAAVAERYNGGTLADIEHIALHDPADAIRRYERDLRVWERHAPIGGVGGVRWCADFDKLTGAEYGLDWPCDDYLDLAAVYTREVPKC
jgi:hypothetical protein